MKRVLFLLIIVLVVVSCKKRPGEGEETHTSGFIKIACDENFKNLIDAEIQVFEATTQLNAIIQPIYTTEKEALRLLVEDSVRLAIVTRDAYPSEKKKLLDTKSLEIRGFSVAFDGIAFVTNKINPDTLLTTQNIEDMLLGEVKRWKELNSASPLDTIRIIFDNKDSGVLRYVSDSIVSGRQVAAKLYALDNAQQVLDKVIELPNSIGIVGANVLSDEYSSTVKKYKKQLNMVRISKEAVATKENSFLPYAGDINREDYPYWRPVLALLSDPTSGLSSGFTTFLTSERGQKIVLQSGLLPIEDTHILSVRIVNKAF